MSKKGEKKAKNYGKDTLSDNEIIDKLTPLTPGLSEKYIHESISYEYGIFDTSRIYPINEENGSLKRILNRALLLERLDETARERGIDPKYIHKFASHSEIDRKGAYRRIINRALKLQKEDGGLTSKLTLLIVTVAIIIEGLFLLSSNLTGYAIGNLTNSTPNIIGIVLFAGGLIFLFFWLRKK